MTLRVVFLSDWLTNPYKRLLADHLQSEDVEVKECLRCNIFLPQVIQFIGIGRPGILHLHTLRPLLLGRNKLFKFLKISLFIGQLLLLRISGVRTVWTVHEWSNKMGNNELKISPRTIRILGFFIHGFITHCPSTQTEIETAFAVKNKVFVVPHGNYIDAYDNTITPQNARAILGIPAENLAFLLFGNIYYYKGYLEAIEAFQQLEQHQITLIVAGYPQEVGLEEELIEKIGGNTNIVFHSKRIADDEIQLYMNAADCIVVPYKVFTTSGVAILAMSFGRACIAPNIGFFKDMLDETGSFLYDANQTDGLRHSMKSAIDHQHQIAAMGQHNLSLAKQWNWNFVAKKTVKIYNQCLAN